MQLEQEEECGLTGHSVAARNHRSPLCTSPPKSTLSLRRCCQRPCLNTMPKQPVQKEHSVNLSCQKAKKEDICSTEFMVTRAHVVNSHHNKNVSIPPLPRSSSYLHNHCGKQLRARTVSSSSSHWITLLGSHVARFTWKPGDPEPVDVMHFCQPPRTQKTLEEWKVEPEEQTEALSWSCVSSSPRRGGGEVGVEGGTVKSWMQKDFGKCQAFV
ncbi:uncharacterized protein LOC111091283 isoform X4 [Canis lupus familiaris]|uniref:uncharacterized protein LOC111091283 isoform X4 n=1 Tax=Canis lupus familiaris TaxID=9615 RepID=UPI000BAA12C3|nr:uncharacterized protein LOC111091283 isoform X4 [Canis lupus familiaris]|eukprot:XP_022262174.1 uncharacterized protein LOC111091283 [Canis lupus familiaris]